MAIAAAEDMVNYLRKRLERYASAVVDECQLGLTDEARKAEDLFMHLFNEAGKPIGFEFYNLNGTLTEFPTINAPQEFFGLNFPAVDLADDKNGVCIQITFQSGNFQQKTDSTINGFYKHELDKTHTRIWIVFASQMRAPKVKINGHDSNLTSIFGMQDIVDWVKYQNNSFNDNSPLERAHDCVKYWLDLKIPSSLGVIDTDLHHEKAVSYQKELNKISSNLFYGLERYDHCREIDLQSYRTLKTFVTDRQSAARGVGSTFKKWSQLPMFRALEEKIDALAEQIYRSVENFDPNFKFPYGWSDSIDFRGFATGNRSFQYGQALSEDELSYCKSLRKKLLNLHDLIERHQLELRTFGQKPY
ncbi:SMEK domain-containing protein [Pseudomonas sp. 3-2]|uniref:SMEK domain-containing protein n=1 Tax=Pseudomonas sp. 3-2 TaxID=2867408 RepID=UPI001C87C3FB|nr:SMEK domain-containing protein [Pseudomonas sp. 3-2]QZD69028.1 SMEK domain-containing protein [Pseudomonas sp. 3-2]